MFEAEAISFGIKARLTRLQICQALAFYLSHCFLLLLLLLDCKQLAVPDKRQLSDVPYRSIRQLNHSLAETSRSRRISSASIQGTKQAETNL